MVNMENLGQRIARLRKAKRLSQHALSELCGWQGQSRVGNYESGAREPNLADLRALAAALGTSLMQIIEGGENVETALSPEHSAWIPLISWLQAAKHCSDKTPIPDDQIIARLPCPQKHGHRTFALKVVGDSMTSPYPGQRSYPDGIIIYVDPDKGIENGSRVIAKDPDTGEATFKTYSVDGGRIYLRPINPSYPSIQIDASVTICGVVIGSYMPE